MAEQKHISAYLGAYLKPKEETKVQEKQNVFEVLNAINVNGHTEEKNGLTYLSWAWAWAEVKKRYPGATYEVLLFDGLPYVYDPNTGYMVYTTVTIEGQTHMMWLPVMDGANKAMKAEAYTYTTGYGQYKKEKVCEAATMFDVNKTIMRCLVKNLAMFGAGLYIYAGEDLPEEEAQQTPAVACGKCGAPITDGKRMDGSRWPASDIVEYTKLKYGQPLCVACGKAAAKESK